MRLAAGSEPMKILELGGTVFVRSHLVEAAKTAGYTIVTFTRGRTYPGLPGVETIRGDRTLDFAALAMCRAREAGMGAV